MCKESQGIEKPEKIGRKVDGGRGSVISDVKN